MGLRHPLLVAQQWANLDALSRGRMTLVACPGEPPGDTPPGHCAQRVPELAASGATDIMVGLLSADPRGQPRRITEQRLPLITDR
jgi:hypothetical protein